MEGAFLKIFITLICFIHSKTKPVYPQNGHNLFDFFDVDSITIRV